MKHETQQKRSFQRLGVGLIIVLACCSLASAQSWTALTFPFPGSAGTAVLQTDGRVMVQDSDTGIWLLLEPTLEGTYAGGTWAPVPVMPGTDNPLYFASAILPDDRMVVEGGEYQAGTQDDSTLGAIYDERLNAWGKIKPPSGWKKIGDAPSVVLPDGTLMLGSCCSAQEALLDAKTLTWTSTGTGKADPNSEEGWTLLPNRKVLTVDAQNGSESELYDPATGKWSLAGNTPTFLGNDCNMNIVPEMGPAVLRPNGTVFQAGATSETAIYTVSTGKWSKGPSFPEHFGVADGPAALLPTGNVLVQASNIDPCFEPPSIFYEFNGSKLVSIPQPPNAPVDASYTGRMVVLPTGGILFTDGTPDVEIYTPAGSAKSAWAPKITSAPTKITRGDSYTLKGTQFNGLSQGAAYGDDAQSATNFPLVRIRNTATGHEYYARTKSFSTMAVATGSETVSCVFVAPGSMETGPASLVVVANGIKSNVVDLTVE
jgi:hypothetical protein